MQKLLRISLIPLGALQLLALAIAIEQPARAYIDPGSGLLAFQVGGSMLAGMVYFLRFKIRKLLGMNHAVSEVAAPAEAKLPAAEHHQTRG